MSTILDWIFEGIANWIASIVTSIMDAISGIFLNALGTDMTAMEEYFPFVTMAFTIMQYTAWALLFIITVWQLFRTFGGPITEAENPWHLLARSTLFAFLIAYAKPIFGIALDIARAPYTALMDASMDPGSFTFAGVENVLSSGLVTLVSAVSVVGLLLQIILMIALGWNYFKLLLEVVERYIVVGVLCYTSPLAFAMGGSKATNKVFQSWCRMIGSQMLLLVMNVWFLRAFNSSVGHFAANGGALTSGHGNVFLNFSKDVFRCALCGWNGGIFDLYAYYMNTPRENVRDELIQKLKPGSASSGKKPPARAAAIMPPEITESPAADIDIRYAAYTTLLSMLSLAQDHKLNLMGRGLPEDVIIKNDYKTTPMVGGKVIAKRLQESGCRIEGVPGFYKDKTGIWTFIENRRGILVPVRDIQGRIQGMQVRRDNEEKRKYRWVSSAGIENGCGAESWTHLAGPVRERIILIEGPMKADVVYHLTGQTALAVPGVNALKHLERALSELKELGVSRVTTAFDMDFLKNPHVQNGYAELVTLLGRLNLQFGTYLWRPDFNGLDDYIWECCMNHERTI